MGYWLAGASAARTQGFVKRFDARFWTVDFPRPMMASVVTTAPDALRVDAVFYKANDLAGLIWEAEDRWDHPLLAYETARDFRHCRFALPLLLPGQADKEAYHNEALARIDAALHASVVDGPLVDPPFAPSTGQSWVVGSGASGAWAGQNGNLAAWTGGGWRFVAPVPGMTAWHAARGCWIYWTGTGWSDGRLPATSLFIGGVQAVGNHGENVLNPAGGTVIDVEARAVVDAIIATLRSHGLIES